MKKIFLLAVFCLKAFWIKSQIIITGFMPNPSGDDLNYEYIQLMATQDITLSQNNRFCVVIARNSSSTDGWGMPAGGGGTNSYKIQIPYQNQNGQAISFTKGQVFYVGGTNTLINGAGSDNIVDNGSVIWFTQDFLSEGDNNHGAPFTSQAANLGAFGNGTQGVHGIALFNTSANISSTTVPIDAILYSRSNPTQFPSYRLPNNDLYNGGVFTGTNNQYVYNYNDSDNASGDFIQLRNGVYNTTTNNWTTDRTVTQIENATNLAQIQPLITLPLTLISFKAEPTANTVVLKWVTANEEKVKEFVLQKSDDAVAFSEIATIQAKNQQANTYEFLTENSFHTVYYRLKMVDEDGVSSYSKVVAVNESKTASLTIFPSVIRSESALNMDGIKLSNAAKAAIYNLEGRKLKVQSILALPASISVGELAAGNYVLVFEQGNERISKRFIKL